MTSDDVLLPYCLRDLAKYVRPGLCQYDYLNIARLLRQLLLDRPGMVDGANRRHRVPLEFRASLVQRRESGVGKRSLWFSSRMDSIDPDVFPRGEAGVVKLTRDRFLSLEIMILEGRNNR
jgi:hypothetical protein